MDHHQPAWYCIRTLHKREPLVCGHLRRLSGVEVFFPRLKWPRRSGRRIVEATEPLFPNYLFARFRLSQMRERMENIPGAKGIVCFGHRCPTVPDSDIDDLRAEFGPDQVMLRPDLHLEPGVDLAAVTGVLKGFRVMVRYDLPVARRLQVLIDLLRRSAAPSLSRRDDAILRLSFRSTRK